MTSSNVFGIACQEDASIDIQLESFLVVFSKEDYFFGRVLISHVCAQLLINFEVVENDDDTKKTKVHGVPQ